MRHYRLASKKLGDDATLTRYIRVGHSQGAPRKKIRQLKIPGLASAYIEEGRTRFGKSVKHVSEMRTLLVDGHSNVKIGHNVRKGKYRGYHIYTLSFEERKTCPRSCQHWQTCYGNNMPYAKRIRHDDPEFLPRLEAEIATLMRKPWPGILIRLHALGDFYSIEYVAFWKRMLKAWPRLSVYGYTARNNEDSIGEAVNRLRGTQWDRFAIRSSNGARHNMATVSIGSVESRPASAFVCPEQTGQTRCCATCGLCWSTRKNVAFLEH